MPGSAGGKSEKNKKQLTFEPHLQKSALASANTGRIPTRRSKRKLHT